jgi:hypothetical protein
MTLRERLIGLSPCPLPDAFFESVGEEVGADMCADVSDISGRAVLRAKARLYFYLATMPNISEGGVSISFTATEKDAFLKLARRFANLAGEEGFMPGTVYGYKGENP